MTNKHSNQIRFYKPPPKLLNRLGYVVIVLSGLSIPVARFFEKEYPLAVWGPRVAVPLMLLGLFAALIRRGLILDCNEKALIHTKRFLGMTIAKKPQPLTDFTRVRLSEDEMKMKGQSEPRTVHRLFLEGRKAPALLAIYEDENEAKQRVKAIASMTELPISWPQV